MKPIKCKYLYDNHCVILDTMAPRWCRESEGDCREKCQIHSSRQMSNRQWLAGLDNDDFATAIVGIIRGCSDMTKKCETCDVRQVCGSGADKNKIIEWLSSPRGLDEVEY